MTIKLANSNTLRLSGVAVFLLCFSIFQSCEKEIKINIAPGQTSLVIEGQIENGLPPFVMITKSMGFFSKVDLSTLENNFIHGALVTISDGTITDTLKEYNLDTTNASFYFYSVDTNSLGNAILAGEFNKTYKLTVSYEGKTYEASTTIPSVTPVDSFYADTLPIRFPGTPDDAVALYINVKDPDTSGNFFRYYTKRNDEPYYPVDVASSEEFGANGAYLPRVNIGFGYSRSIEDTSAGTYPLYGDSLTLKWSAIDRNVYKFWQTYQFAINVVGNPFASPTNLPSNFSNGALGIWAGYGTFYIKIQEYRNF